MEDRSEKEKVILYEFRKIFNEFPSGKLKKYESPDFLLLISPKKRIGIELTEIYDAISEEVIEYTIRKKEEKIKLYQEIIPFQLWLIMHTVQFYDIPNHRTLSNAESSSFDRIFLFHNELRKISVVK